jgi:hypothetical protein
LELRVMTVGIDSVRQTGCVHGQDAAAAGDYGKAEVSVAQQSMQRMRIVLQQKETGLYFKDVGSWVRNGMEAMDFVSSSAAIDFCVLNKLKDVQLVFKFEEQQYDIVLPVQPGQKRAGARAGI